MKLSSVFDNKKNIGAAGQKGDCIQPEPIISRPGTKGEPGPAGLPGKRKKKFRLMLVYKYLLSIHRSARTSRTTR